MPAAAIHIKYPKVDLILCGSLSTLGVILLLCNIRRFDYPFIFLGGAGMAGILLFVSLHFWVGLWRNQSVMKIDATGIYYQKQVWTWDAVLSFRTVTICANTSGDTQDQRFLMIKSWDKKRDTSIFLTALNVNEQQVRQWVNEYCPLPKPIDEGHFQA